LDDDADCDGVRDDGLTDDDGDGWTETEGDCDDEDEFVGPTSSEGRVANGIDDDCDCYIDDLDLDGDGATELAADRYDPGIFSTVSDPSEGFCADPALGDCDDADDKIFPGAVELPYDEIDNDCDGADLCDVDADGHDAEVCGGDDCDDLDAEIHPGLPDAEAEIDGKDNDCDGVIDVYDQDGDGFGMYEGDCDDLNPTSPPTPLSSAATPPTTTATVCTTRTALKTRSEAAPRAAPCSAAPPCPPPGASPGPSPPPSASPAAVARRPADVRPALLGLRRRLRR
jgi:hypothetical protein